MSATSTTTTQEAVFERAKGKVSSESKAIDTNLDEQDELMSTIDTQNELFVAARSTDTSNKKREEALQRLQSAVDAFQKLHHELKVCEGPCGNPTPWHTL